MARHEDGAEEALEEAGVEVGLKLAKKIAPALRKLRLGLKVKVKWDGQWPRYSLTSGVCQIQRFALILTAINRLVVTRKVIIRF
jgi:hypothetical protein